jgi:hypothetical protein
VPEWLDPAGTPAAHPRHTKEKLAGDARWTREPAVVGSKQLVDD